MISTVAEINEAIAKLSPQEYYELMGEPHPFPDDERGKQMIADPALGSLTSSIGTLRKRSAKGPFARWNNFLKTNKRELRQPCDARILEAARSS
jgi:hypothetical protein